MSEESKENWDLDTIPLYSSSLNIAEAVCSSTLTEEHYEIKNTSNTITELMPPPSESVQPDFSCLIDEEGNRTSGMYLINYCIIIFNNKNLSLKYYNKVFKYNLKMT